jgi:hypothetical protein
MTTTTNGKATELITFSRGSLATVTDSDGKIKWAPHNLLTNSEQFDSSNWVKSESGVANLVLTANAAAAPNGTTTAEQVNFGAIDAAGDYSIIFRVVAVTAGSHTLGIFLKAVAAGDVGKKIWIYAGTGGSNVGLTGCVLTADWKLFTVPITAATGNLEFTFGVLGSTYGGENQGAVSTYVWGAHLYRADLGGMQSNPSAYPMYNPSTPRNLAAYSENLGFTGAGGWGSSGNVTVVTDAAAAPNGSLTADLVYPTSTGTNRQRYQSPSNVTSGTRYVVSAYLKSAGMQWAALLSPNGANYGAYFDLLNGVTGTVASGVTATITSVGNGWYRCSVSQVTSGTTIYPGISLADADNSTTSTTNGTNGVYAWGFQVSDSASLDAYVPSFGPAPSAAAAHGARLDYRNGSALGLLVEEARTNIALRSEEFDNVQWTKAGLAATPVVANTVASPDGTVDADKLVENTSLTSHGVYNSVGYTTVSGQPCTFSVYAKAAERSFVVLDAFFGTSAFTWFNLSNGTVGTNAAGNTASIQSVGNGWYRCTVTRTSTNSTAASTFFGIYMGSADNVFSYTGDGTSGLYVWGTQVEANASFPTSYLPTAAATVTRNADVASVGVSQFPYSQGTGSLIVSLQAPAVNQSAVIAGFNTSTFSNTIEFQKNDGTGNAAGNAFVAFTFDGGSTTLNLAASANNGLVNNLGMAWDAAGISGVVNGGTVASGTYRNAQPVKLNIGGRDTFQINGWIRQVTYLPRKLSSSELQSRTA